MNTYTNFKRGWQIFQTVPTVIALCSWGTVLIGAISMFLMFNIEKTISKNSDVPAVIESFRAMIGALLIFGLLFGGPLLIAINVAALFASIILLAKEMFTHRQTPIMLSYVIAIVLCGLFVIFLGNYYKNSGY